MKIILTDEMRYCPEELPQGYKVVRVNEKTLANYSDNDDVEVVLGTRALVRALYGISLPSCKLVQLFSVGYDDIDLDWFKQKSIPLCNASGIYDNVLAEYVVYALLLYAKRFHRSLKNRWFRPLRNYHYITELAGKTVGIMGCGRIASAVVRRLAGFDMTIIGYAQHTESKEGFLRIYHKESIDEFFSRCDYVVNTLPHDKSTIGLIDNGVLSYAKSNMTFINIGRDSIFNKDDFYQFLKSHKDMTAILDMYELLPNPITNKYRRLSNVLVTPRVASVSPESTMALKELIKDNIHAVVNNKQLSNRII